MARSSPVAAVLEYSGAGFALRRAWTWRGLLVLNYHRIGDGRASLLDRALWSATQEQFDEQLHFLKRHFAIVTPGREMFADAARHRRAVAITFDDGYRDNYELAFGVLREHGIKACFFLATGYLDRPRLAWWDEISWMLRTSSRAEIPAGHWLPETLMLDPDAPERPVRALLAIHKALPADRTGDFMDWLGAATGTGRPAAATGSDVWMTWEMAREMQAAGMVFGAHSVDHPVLSACAPSRQAAEIADSLTRIREELGGPVSLFSYPDGQRGSYDAVTRACLREAGVDLAFGFHGGYAPGPADPFDVPRIGVSHEAWRTLFRARATLPQVFAREGR